MLGTNDQSAKWRSCFFTRHKTTSTQVFFPQLATPWAFTRTRVPRNIFHPPLLIMDSWQDIASACQELVLDAIPCRWRLSEKPESSVKDVRDVPATCGLMTEKQLAITEQETTQLVSHLHDGRLTSVEVTEAFCARAAIAHQCVSGCGSNDSRLTRAPDQVNCLTGFFYDEAIARASELDATLRDTGKPVGPLHGLPIAIKDTFEWEGKAGTFGLMAWRDKKGKRDASIIKLLKAAGAVLFAKTAMPQTGMLLETVSNLWGRTKNPYNRDFSAGGSSGGDGALVAMHGSPFCPSTDIGGSIRAPATFNGLYGIRPTSERIPRSGLLTVVYGQISIKVSCGPTCHSMGDVKLVTKLLLTHRDYIGVDPTAAPVAWQDKVEVQDSLVFGVLRTDGCVTPQPPVARALDELVKSVKAAGHRVVEIEPPFDLWEASQVTWKLYFQTGAKEVREIIASSGEPVLPNFTWYLNTFNIKALTVPELFQLNVTQAAYKVQFAQAWANTKAITGSGRPIDGLLCPCAPSAGFSHDFPVWWGYYSIWNLLDYPSVIMPLKGFRIDPILDVKDGNYIPKENVFDKMNWEAYDPELWKNQPVCVQIVKPPYQDEELIAVAECIDKIYNASSP
ncbi:Amidase [Purpureocillium takamizusanense]|uniref:Amidase n=1 Tax=Purpureocillium takamizusanense TaxID=2060973 RepID=A0A9Q8QGD6_9HYPO|nr:Amidase [Purpureocillium takamizusanense]UNI18404.1 Amidase [Purpureocillium takamizusanense]